MANGATLTVEDFTQSVAEQIASQLKIQPDVLMTKLIDSLSKGLIEKFVGKPITQSPIKQPDNKIDDKKTGEQTVSNNKVIEETIISNIPKMVEKLTEIASLIGNVFDSRSGITRQEKFPDILKTPLQKLTKDFEATTKSVLELNAEDDERAEGVEPSQQKTFLEQQDKPKPVLFAGFTQQGLRELEQVMPSILNKKGVEALSKQKQDTSGGSMGMGLPGGGGLLKGILAALATLGGVLAIFYGLQTEGPFKGLAKLVGRGLLSAGKFTKVVNGLITGMIDSLVKLPLKLVKTFGKGLKLVFGKQASGAFGRMVGTGIAKLTGLVPKFLATALRFLKGAPFVGALISIGFAVSRFMKGDIIGGGIDVLSGIASLFPGPGTFISYALDALNAFLDYKAGGIGEKSKGKGAVIMDWVKNLGSWLAEKMEQWPIIGPLIRSFKEFSKGNFLNGLKQLVYIVPLFETIGAMLGDKETGTVAQGMGNWIKNLGKWMQEKLRDIPIIGPAIKAAEEFSKGNYLKGLKQLVYIVPLFETIGAMLGDKETGAVAQGMGNIVKKIGAWIAEKIREVPVIGPAIRASEEFSKGNYLKGLKQLAYIFPPFEMIGALLGDKETGGVAQGGAGILKSIGSFLKGIKDSILRAILNLLPEKILGISIRSRAASLLGIDMGAVADDPQTANQQQESAPKPARAKVTVNGKEMTLEEFEQWKASQPAAQPKPIVPVDTSVKMEEAVKQPLPQVVEPSEKSSPAPDLAKEVGDNIVNNYALGNSALDKIANNSDISNKNIANLVGGFNTLAVALEKLGISLKDSQGQTTIINQNEKGRQGAVGRSTEFAKVGNTTITDFRRFIEASRLNPA
jgi:hypothetical protein